MKQNKSGYIFSIFMIFPLLILAAAAQTNENPAAEIVASGGSFTLVSAVVAGGGNETSQSTVKLSGTSGQSVAGVRSTGGSFSLYSGFWTPDDFAPTAANLVAGGCIKTSDGRGVRNVSITVTFSNGQNRSTISGTFGYYRFSDLPAGGTYIFTVSSKRFQFAQSSQVRTILDDTQDIDFVAVNVE